MNRHHEFAIIMGTFFLCAGAQAASHPVAGGFLSVGDRTGEFRAYSPLAAVKAELMGEGDSYSLLLRSGDKEYRFSLSQLVVGKDKSRSFTGKAANGAQVILLDNTTCEGATCHGPDWSIRVTRAAEKDFPASELSLAGEVTVYPEPVASVVAVAPSPAPSSEAQQGSGAQLAGKVGMAPTAPALAPEVSAPKPMPSAIMLPPADIGSIAPEPTL